MSYTRLMRARLWVCVAVLAAAPRVGAVTVLPIGFSELVNQSASVVYARVSDVRARWTDDRHGIESFVTVDVMTAFKGPGVETLTFTVPGGQVGRYINLIPGAPAFARGDLVVLFLTSSGARIPTPTGFSQGIYRVMADARTGTMVVVPPIVGATDAGPAIVRGDPQRRPLSLPAFEAAVHAARMEQR